MNLYKRIMLEKQKKEYIKTVSEVIKCHHQLDFFSLIIDNNTGIPRTYDEFLKSVDEYIIQTVGLRTYSVDDYNRVHKGIKEFLIKCYEIRKALSPCPCEDHPYIIDLANILWILQTHDEMFGENFINPIDWEKQIKILNVSENYLKLLYYTLNAHSFIEHAGDIKTSWLSGKLQS